MTKLVSSRHLLPPQYSLRIDLIVLNLIWNRKCFVLVEGSLTGQSDKYRSGSIQDRAEELNQLIRDPSVRCIMLTIGGTNSNSLLPYIDYEALKSDPKIIIGYSDVNRIAAWYLVMHRQG